MKMTIVQCQRIIGRLERKIAKKIARADDLDRKADFAMPGSDYLLALRSVSRDIRSRTLPELYTLLHHYQSRLPREHEGRSEAIARRLLGLAA